MEFLLGVVGKDFVLVATDVLNIRSIMVLSQDTKKVHSLSSHKVLCATGESGEVDRLRERLQAEAALAHYRMGRAWSTKETANFTRSLLAEHLRTRSPYQCEILIAGIDESPEMIGLAGQPQNALVSTTSVRAIEKPVPSLFWMDHLGSLQPLSYAAHGYGGFFTWGLLDAYYKADMGVDEAICLVAKVIKELQTRFIVQLPRLCFTLIDSNGTHEVIFDWAEWNLNGQVAWTLPSQNVVVPVHV